MKIRADIKAGYSATKMESLPSLDLPRLTDDFPSFNEVASTRPLLKTGQAVAAILE